MYLRAHEVFVDQHELNLTPKEFSVLRLLLEHRGEVMTTATISTKICGWETFGQRNFLEAHVSRLRSKLAAGGAAGVVNTVRGVEYVSVDVDSGPCEQATFQGQGAHLYSNSGRVLMMNGAPSDYPRVTRAGAG